MHKITNPTYYLPGVLPLQKVQLLGTGANKPMLIRGVYETTYTEHEFVVKYRGAERMDEAASRRELLASWMASEVGVWTPEPVVVQIDADFIQQAAPYLPAQAVGLNFGTWYVHPTIPFSPNPTLPRELLQTAARIFAFDMLIQNCDRRNEKPNAFQSDGKIYIYDHELSFNFLVILPLLANPTPWVFNSEDIQTAQNHLFYPVLQQQRRSIDWDAAASTFTNLTPTFWRRATELLPEPWADDAEMARIQAHTESILQQLTSFRDALWKVSAG